MRTPLNLLAPALTLGLLAAAGSASAGDPPPAKPPAPAKPDGAAKPEGAAKPAEAPDPTKTPAFQMAAHQTIAGSAAQIDACTECYTDEFPDRSGTVALQFELTKDGRVQKSKADSALQASDVLKTCLRDVARQWRFPAVGEAKVVWSLSIPVAKGEKFELRKPGEAPKPPPAPGRPRAEGDEESFLNFEALSPSWEEP